MHPSRDSLLKLSNNRDDLAIVNYGKIIGNNMRLNEITSADRRRIRLRSEAALPYQGIPGQPAQPARRTRTGIQAPRPPQPPKPPPKAVPPAPAEPPEPPQPPSDGGEHNPPKQVKQPKQVIKSK